jgi:hypothetical protein
LPHLEFNKTKITQLSIISVSVENFVKIKDSNEDIKVMHKLNLYFNPCKRIALEASAITGLTNELLENEKKFDMNALNLLISFFNQLQAPICLIAHNGNLFDFKILKTEVDRLKSSLPDSIYCCDSLQIFRKIDEIIEQNKRVLVNGFKLSNWEHMTDEEIEAMNEEIRQVEKIAAAYVSSDDDDVNEGDVVKKEKLEISLLEDCFVNGTCYDLKLRQLVNEKTPRKPIKTNNIHSHQKVIPESSKHSNKNVRRELFPRQDAKKLPKKFSLREIHYRFFGAYPDNAHDSEADCLALLKCAKACNIDFIETIMNGNLTKFCDVKGF